MTERAPRSAVETIEGIIEANERLRAFWTQSDGWAPKAAAEMLAKSRLDRQVALSHTLMLWVDSGSPIDSDGRLILAWTNLGALLEGSLKTLLSVYLDTYRRSTTPIHKRGKPIDPDEATLEALRVFFVQEVWTASQVDEWDSWTSHIAQRRNAVHAFRERDIGTFSEFYGDLALYERFVKDLGLPYPD